MHQIYKTSFRTKYFSFSENLKKFYVKKKIVGTLVNVKFYYVLYLIEVLFLNSF